MIKTSNYNSLIELYPFMEDEYRGALKSIPDIRAICIDEFLDDIGDWDNYSAMIAEYLLSMKNILCLGEKNTYLCIAERGHGGTEKIRGHYKLWKSLALDFDLSCFELGFEYDFILNGSFVFGGVAKVDVGDIAHALGIINKPGISRGNTVSRRSFLYTTSDDTLLQSTRTKEVFDNLSCAAIKPFVFDEFDYSTLFAAMEAGASIVKVLASDVLRTTIIMKR
jgi:hypothetical protein